MNWQQVNTSRHDWNTSCGDLTNHFKLFLSLLVHLILCQKPSVQYDTVRSMGGGGGSPMYL